jgi:hypothetical protein
MGLALRILDEGPKLMKMVIRFGAWKVTNVEREGYLRGIRCCCMDWIDLPLVNA